jgi:aquaporin Z
MNPARSLGPELGAGGLTRWWVYVASPLLVGLLAVVFAWILRGPPSRAASATAQGEDAPRGRNGNTITTAPTRRHQ